MRVLIFGATGMIGHRVWLSAREKWGSEVFGVVRRSFAEQGCGGLFDQNILRITNATDWGEAEKILSTIKPNVIVNALGVTVRKIEITDMETALTVNSFFPRRLLKWAQQNNSRVIHFSTDCVFDGVQGNYLEVSQPSAKDNYGKTKFLGEIEGSNALTLRFSCIGRELDSHTELLDWFLGQRGKTIKGYSRAMYSGVTTSVIAQEVCRVISDFPKLEGLFQLSSSPISKYDLLCLAKEYFKMDVEIEKFDNYVSDKTLICDKYKKATGFKVATWNEMMKEISSDQRIAYKNL